MPRTERLDWPDPETNQTAIVSVAELHLLVDDFESLVTAGVMHGTRDEAAEFFSGWLAFGDQRRGAAKRINESLLRTSELKQAR